MVSRYSASVGVGTVARLPKHLVSSLAANPGGLIEMGKLIRATHGRLVFLNFPLCACFTMRAAGPGPWSVFQSF